jgi:rRNA maturation RNase YbeY
MEENRPGDGCALPSPRVEGPITLLGDIVISIDTRKAERQMRKYAPDEIKKLIVHGILHLHWIQPQEKGEKEVMREKESRLMFSIKEL